MDYKLYCIQGYYFELVNTFDNKEYLCSFIQHKDGEKIEHYSTTLKSGSWMKIPLAYICDMYVEIRSVTGVLKKVVRFKDHIKGKRVFITFGSSSLGDTIAWMPYCQEFKNVYKCDVIVSTFKNWMFKNAYPELEFVEPGSVVEDIAAMPDLGWHWDEHKEPVNPVTIPLQKAACNILDLVYYEKKPKIDYVFPYEYPIEEKYVCISSKSTAECKHWNKWPELIQALKEKGYRVVELSKDAEDYGAEKPIDDSLQTAMNYLTHCEFYIGLSSGISWLAWAIGTKVVMISNFTESNHEFDCIRVENRSVCNGCWNDPKFKFNKGDWNWCPVHEDTPQQFECHRTITVSDVVNKIIESGLWQ